MPYIGDDSGAYDDFFKEGSVRQRMSQLIYNGSGSLMTRSNWVQLLNDGVNIFPVMLAAISGAKHHIHLQSYIFRDDELGNVFFDLLAAKASEGVQVRIIVDGVGSLGLGQEKIKELDARGVEIRIHFPIRFSVFRNRLNYRNHRKILVVDGLTGFVGGANVGNDYLGLYAEIGNWRDTQLVVHGPATTELQRLFFQDWITISGELPGDNPGRFFPGFTEKNELTNETAFPDLSSALNIVKNAVSVVLNKNEDHDTANVRVAAFFTEGALPRFDPISNKAVQIAASGPDSHYASIMHAYHYAISSARETINITSPYFIPNQSILTALKTAALAGVEINLLVPRNPDQQMVYMAAMTYFEELMDDGVKVWLYHKGFLHSKIVTVDDDIAIVGTANMDQRSFSLNFEVSALIYDKIIIEELNGAFQNDLADSTLLDPAEFRKRPLLRRILESGCRLLSPLL
jgi:cardiolipin synthase